MSKTTGRKPPGLRISELAKLADVSIPTIKHYLKEGLLPRPIKTGRTMSYYDESCVDRVRLIKRLQNERFLPLYVIKQILESETDLDQELILREGILGISRLAIPTRVVTPGDIERATGYDAQHLARAEEMGVILPQTNDAGTIYDTIDLEILSLIRQREDVGIPFDYSIEMMSIYKRYMKKIVEEDAVLFVRNLLSLESTEEVIKYVWEGDSALVSYMPLIRAKLTRANVERLFSVLRSVPELLEEAFVFRGLPVDWEAIAENPDSADFPSMLWRIMDRPEERDGATPASADGPTKDEIRELAAGIAEINRGLADDALSRLTALSGSGRLEAMVHALAGVACIGRAVQSSGFMPIISNVKQALSHFDRSREASRHRATPLFTVYVRGMGLSIIPEEFGTSGDAHDDLARVIERGTQAADADRSDTGTRFIGELMSKSTYFLVLMQCAAGRYGRAADRLRALIEAGGEKYYLSWAKKTLKGIEAASPDPETTGGAS